MADAVFDRLVRAHGADLLRFAYLLSHDRGRAEDLVQDALLNAVRRWRRTGVPELPVPYLRRSIVNGHLGWRRRRASTELVDEVGGAAALEDDASQVQADRDAVWRMLAALPVRARAVLVLRYYEDLPDAAIAETLGCAEATVRSLAARAFAVLRDDPRLAEFHVAKEA
jgi:RNA polymerase sigma-70 factor (sigma-E family)